MEKLKERRGILADALRKDFKEEAQRLVQLLKTKGFKFRRIYLFGSTTKDKLLCPWSDLDLVIEGLQRAMFFKAYACLLKNAEFTVDLKPFEELGSSIKEKLKREGQIIYEEK